MNKAYFPLKFWITNHSKLPSFGYADGHISSRTLAKWIPEEPAYKELEERLNHPDPELLEMILAEKDSAIAIAEDALQQLEAAKSLIPPVQYEDLQWRLELLRRTTLIWKAHAEAFFGYKILVEGHEVPGLRESIDKALNVLYTQAEISEEDPWVRTLQPGPGSPEIIREVTDELKMLLGIS